MASQAERIREQLSHPVLDCDGHWWETLPVLYDYVRDVAGPQVAEELVGGRRSSDGGWYAASQEERMRHRMRRPDVQWPTPGDTRDKATAMLPGLLAERLPELGIDFAIVYGTLGLGLPGNAKAELRQAGCRAYNRMVAELFGPHMYRLTPAAAIPMYTPDEAIVELEYAIERLGLKAIMLRGPTRRDLPESPSQAYYFDSLGLDSPYNFDPFWARCVELGVAVTNHGGSRDWADRASVTNFTYNHIGHFAQNGHVFAKGLFLGGVTKRFPRLNFGLLEGGVGWAVNLMTDLVGHWEKLNPAAIKTNRHPSNTDVTELRALFERYGAEPVRKRLDDIMAGSLQMQPHNTILDDYGQTGVENRPDIVELFRRNFYFGCEADDPLTAWAFDERAGGKLKAVFSSDIGHWDVARMDEVLPEAFELVEDGLMGEQEFREFAFANAVHLHGEMNPNFFAGTAIEKEAAAELAGPFRG
ncbi:MAG: amidohydrolase family protein [Chloroflexi bacterium]|nr:amidohydrolase family protein [Chloroflexota bacterium]